MPHKLSAAEPQFMRQLMQLLSLRHRTEADISHTVRDILSDVKVRGDVAVAETTTRFDNWNATPANLRMGAEEIRHAAANCDTAVRAALARAAERIRAYHETQRPSDHRYTDGAGVTLGWKYTPIDAVGLYVPGGKASYPSSVLMNAIPARVAGVERIAMVVPTPKGEINPAVFAAAEIAGVDEIYRIGGAQAVAALAYGTSAVAAVDKIVGPGNAYVAEAKRQVFGTVGIDTIAGPSEILVAADANNDPTWIAADLLSQAEHDEAAQSILITNDEGFASAVTTEIATLLATFRATSPAHASWRDHGIIITVAHWEQALPIIAAIAPEHLELALDEADALAARIKNAGAIFLGRHTPEAFGDYIAGPSHVLPTSRAARFASGLSVFDFLNRTSIISAPEKSPLLAEAATLADAEGLPAHALSLRVRL